MAICVGRSKCERCGTEVEAKIDTKVSPVPEMGKHEFIQLAIKVDGGGEVTYRCYNCREEGIFRMDLRP